MQVPQEIGVGATTFLLQNLEDGRAYYLEACAIDMHGACGPSDFVAVIIDPAPPPKDPANGKTPGGCGCTGNPTPTFFLFLGVLAAFWRVLRPSRRALH